MPLVQGGPPEWIWERPREQLKWEVIPSQQGKRKYELRLNCGLEIVRLQFFTSEEIEELKSALSGVD